MTDKEFVLSVYPQARVRAHKKTILIESPACFKGNQFFEALGSEAPMGKKNKTVEEVEAAAWASAARRIREQQAKGKGEVGNG